MKITIISCKKMKANKHKSYYEIVMIVMILAVTSDKCLEKRRQQTT
jgi:hypothetical protein